MQPAPGERFMMTALFVVLTIFLIPQESAGGRSDSPDLVIEDVSFQVVHHPPQFEKGKPATKAWRSYRFHVLIRNIGTAAFHETFYISQASTEKGIREEVYDGTHRVNTDRRILFPDDTLTVMVPANRTYPPATIVRLFIQSDGKPHGGDPLPRIEEISYDNNAFDFIFTEEP
jgi:hypothetical protein